jgi:N-carbamoyl-L-amino-acid hydrolase
MTQGKETMAKLGKGMDAGSEVARGLFDDLRSRTADGPGVSRDTYGAGEQAGHDLCAAVARDLGLAITTDFARNLYMTLPGSDPALPGWMVGSHVDSVPRGGNFDGAAGVVAGLAAIAAFRAAGIVPARNITVMGIRAEEASSWYGGNHGSHLGSRAALGLMEPHELDQATHVLTGRTLGEHMADAGCDLAAIRERRVHLPAAKYRGYLELHIEQGPVLDERAVPVGIVTGIRGSARARSARCVGEYTHSGAVPREYRHDAVLATTELCQRMEDTWTQVLAEGGDLVFTVGKFQTDSKAHSITKVPGEVAFSMDIRSQDLATLERMIATAQQLGESIGARRGVRFDLGKFNLARPSRMDAALQARLTEAARSLGITSIPIPSGAGHDAQNFSHAGFPAAMIFVRNANGSHNADEAMTLEDFALGTQVLAAALLD